MDEPAGQEDSYLASVSDLMVGLLFVFLILLMAFALNLRVAEQTAKATTERMVEERRKVSAERDRVVAELVQIEAERDRLAREQKAAEAVTGELVQRDTARASLLDRVRATLIDQRVQVTIEQDKGLMRLPEDLLFPSGEAVLRPEGKRMLDAVAQALAATLPCYLDTAPPIGCPADAHPTLETVLIEGHTDDVPIRGLFHDNWELGAARALSTFRRLIEAAPELDRLVNARGQALLGVSSYEARRPVAIGSDEASRRRNRRIDLRFVVAAPEAASLARGPVP